MSALGQKRTCAVQKGMSALPPKADMCGAKRNVRFVPKADIGAKPRNQTRPNLRKGRSAFGVGLKPAEYLRPALMAGA